MQALCQWDVQRNQSADSLGEWLGEQEASGRAAAMARKLVTAYWTRRNEVDGRISAAAAHWSLDRLSMVERNVLRVAATELSMAETPPKVVLNEAIEIGREYGGAETPGFINGVLDRILRETADTGPAGVHGAAQEPRGATGE
jgi:N utilization substance protein B